LSKELSVVGKRYPMLRWFALEKVTGKGKFTVDMKLPGMLYAKMVRSPYAHAKVLKVDTSKAEALPGVKIVLSKENTPRTRRGLILDDWYLFDDKVRLMGEAVAAVAAVDEDTAEEAASLVEVEYEKLPAVLDPEKALETGAPQVQPVANNLAMTYNVLDGDVEKGLKEADYVFEGQYKSQAVVHVNMEPKACVCDYDPLKDKLTVWLASQEPFNDRRFLSRSLDMPIDRINMVVVPHVGGAFGGRTTSQVAVACALLAKRTGRPVKFEISRSEEWMGGEGHTRHASIARLKTGVKKDGTIVARQANYVLDTGAYADGGPAVVRCVGEKWTWLYRSPHVKFEGKLVYTNNPIASGMRGYGEPQAMWPVESQMDEIAEKLGMDPIEIRMKNHVQAGEVNLKRAGLSVSSCGLDDCIRRGAERIGWEKRQKKPGAEGGVKKRGIGMGLGMHVSGAWPVLPQRPSAVLYLNEDGTVTWVCGANDIGMGRFTIFSQIIAEELGVRLEDVNVVPASTDTAPCDRGSGATGGTYVQGRAVQLAAADLKRQLFERAARMLNADSEGLEAKDGRIYVKGTPDRFIKIADVAAAATSWPEPHTFIGKASYHPPGNAPPFAANFAEVEVDTETGDVKVLRIVSAIDVGKAINPLLMEGQIEGGLQMALGYALTEQVMVDKDTGRVLNPGFTDYKVLKASDMPPMDVIIVEAIDPTGPFGAKGVGECPVAPTAPAIANAIYNAIGVRIRDLPITPEKILKGLREVN
jgi:xanthine dehydrogenase molybdenum-binding subunit